MHRRVSFGLLLLASACARVPADVSSPNAEIAVTPTASEPQASAGPIASDCKGAELSICAGSCHDAACLEWCAGQSCVATIESLWSCMDDAERRFMSEHPSPPDEYETVTDEFGESYQQPTAAALEREYEWEAAYEAAIDERWRTTCATTCSARLGPPSDESPGFCGDWQLSYHGWERLRTPPPEHESELLGMVASMGALGSLSLGTSASLAGEFAQRYEDPHAAALMHMIRRVGWELGAAESCVPNLDDSGREFAIAIEFGDDGAVQATHVRDDQSGAGECVAGVLASELELPIRVTREYPQLEVRVLVKPTPHFGGVPYGSDDLGGWDDYGGLGWGVESGEGQGSLTGSGRGGGGAIDSGTYDDGPDQD